MNRSLGTIKERAARHRQAKGMRPRKRFEWTNDSRAMARQMRQEGRSYGEIAACVGCHEKTVRGLLAALCADRTSKQPVAKLTVPPRTIVNSTMRERLTGGDWTPNRPGAMDYARIPSRGIT